MSARIQLLGENAAMLSASQLRRRYIIALSLIAILTIVSQAVMQYLITDQKYDSRIVNIAGRQRMLSQKITKLSYYISSSESPEAASGYRKDLSEALSLWERSHVGLLRGDDEMGLPGRNSKEVIALFNSIQQHHEAIVGAAKAILSSTGAAELPQLIQKITTHEADFLKGMNDIVFQYDREANAKVEFAKRLEIGLMGITLLVLVLEAVFIFSPATRRIQRDMQELADREEDLDLLFSVSPTALLLVEKDNLAILTANQKAMELIGVSIENITNSNLRNYVDADYEANQHFIAKISKGETLNEYEVVLLDARGSVFETLVSVRTIKFSGRPVFVIGITNITELKKAQQTLEHYATFDEMTGLMNRRTGLLMLGKSMARLRRDGGQLTICFVDLDGLKVANDKFGHAAGDWLICAVAKVLTNVIRESDAAVRLGGDEFLVILHDCSREEGENLLTRAEARLKEIEVAENKPFSMGFSSGVTTYAPEKTTTPDELVSEADSLMYQAKQTRKRLRAVAS